MRRSGWHPGYTAAAVSTAALVLTAPGQTVLLSLLNVPLRAEFGLDAFTLNTAYMVATVSASLPLVWVGRLTDRLGPRRMMVLVALLFGGACAFTAAVANLAMVFAALFLMRFLGQGCLSLVSSHALAMWFHRRLGTLSGIRSVVLFAAWAPLPGLTLALISAYGWRATWLGFGVFVAVTLPLLAAWLLRDRPEDVGLGLDGGAAGPELARADDEPAWALRDAKRTPAYWLLAAGSALPAMAGTAILFDIQPLLEARGFDAGAAARAVTAWSAAMALAAIPSGHLVDRARPGRLLAAAMLAVGVSSALFLSPRSEPVVIAAMGIFAIGQSLAVATVATTAARYFGRRHHGAILSSISRVGIVATGVGPLCFGASQRLTGGYDVALIGFAAVALVATLAALAWFPAAAPARDRDARP